MKIHTLILLTCLSSLLAPLNLVAESGSSDGTVAETIDAGSYTYIRIEESNTWIATTTTEVTAGNRIVYSGGSEMRDFYSKSLNQTFESIWFVENVSVAGHDPDQPHQGAVKSHGSPVPISKAVAAPAPGEITKLDGGKTVEEIVSDPASFKGQTVSLRASVTKVSAKIMGKNWITLQDGTGTAPNNKLVATSSELVAVGEIVTAKGVIRNDVDLGYGYHYEALLEEATFTK